MTELKECGCTECGECRGLGRLAEPCFGSQMCWHCGGTGKDMCETCEEAEDEKWQ